MKRTIYASGFAFLCLAIIGSCTTQDPRILVMEVPDENRVDVTIDGIPFTSYIWPDNLEKPVLFPLRTASGKVVTRGFPVEPRPGERTDHPHHVGSWFNYGDVNGLDFWNNSYAIPLEQKKHYGTIRQEKILRTESGKDRGILEVETSWRDPGGNALLMENTTFVFRGNEQTRTIDRITTLTAENDTVHFRDNKEGLIAIRMDKAFEFPSDQPEVYTDAAGNPDTVKVVNNEGRNGRYLSSEGITGKGVWGTRARWMALSAEKENEPISVVIMDHPGNPGFPTYWHARTYGLFAANPLGQSIFSNGEKELNFKLDPGQSVTFKYRILIQSGSFVTAGEVNRSFSEFAEE